MRIKGLTAFLIFLSLGLAAFGQQKAMYTQYMFNTMAINPAYVAVDEQMAVTMLSRHQWVGFAGAPNTQTFSIHTPIKQSNTFVGGQILRDQIGEVITETGAYGTITQRVAIGLKTYLAVGVNGGLSTFKANYSDIYGDSPGSVNDPLFQDESSIRGNFGMGVMLFSDKYYLGVSSPHFYQANLSFSESETKSRPHYMLQAGYLAKVNENLKFKPNFLIKYVNGSPVQFDLNANLLINETLWVGASYRSLDSFSAVASLYITKDIQFGYSYDVAHTALSKVQKGSHEVMLQFRMGVKGRDQPRCYF
ncbi:type IX secretion system membrane protein PorP/SprF [Flavihumibacter sp. R14]|nr:type IX secretion system membrane protein PorP/SprF [Flavihumibacter soli]